MKMFSDGELVKMGWMKMKENIGMLIGATILSMVLIMGIPGLLGWIGEQVGAEGVFALLAFITYVALAALIGAGYLRIFLNIVDGKEVGIGQIFSESKVMFNYILVNIAVGIIVMVGFILFIIPGIIWGLKYQFAPFLVVDKRMKVMEAIKESARMTDGMKWDLLGFQYVNAAVLLLGYLALFVGIIVSAPVAMIAYVGLYRKFTTMMPTSDASTPTASTAVNEAAPTM